MSDLFSIGVSGLVAAQTALATTSNNIANASTTGYTREVTQFKEIQGQQTNYGYLGSGVTTTGNQRQTDTYLNASVQSAQATSSEQSAYYQQVSQISNMLASSSTDIGTSMENLFSSFQQVASDPSSTASRQQVLSDAQVLTDQFQSVGSQLSTLSSSVNQSISSDVTSINNYANQIATLNQQIKTVSQGGNAQPPNDLLDQRDQAVASLSKLVGVSVVSQTDGSENVFIGNGQGLVVGGQPYTLSAVASSSDSTQLSIGFTANGKTSTIADSQITGGDLGGLIAFRNQSLEPATQQLGQLAAGFALTVNAQHELGTDLKGAQGQALFSIPSPQVQSDSSNTGSGTMSASFVQSDAKYLQASDYKVSYDGSNYSITRLSDGSTGVDGAGKTAPASYPASALTNGNSVEVDGVQFSLTGSPSAGDSFLVKPSEAALSGISVALSDPSKVAAAGAPVAVTAASANTGSGSVAVSAYTGSPSYPNGVTLSFGSGGTYSVSGSSGSDVSGATLPANGQITVDGVTLTVSGTPAANDSFTLGNTTSGTGDNQNAVALGALQTGLTLDGATTSFSGAYSDLVGAVGTAAAQYKSTSTTAASILTSTTAAQQAVSGVNLDEEGANLIKYQQQYQAAAKVVQIASTLFASILQLN